MTHPRFKDYFSDSAASYAAFRPTYPPALFDFVASLTTEHRTVWDCATGSGQAAVPLAGYFDRVLATDASAEQIAHATPHERVSYSVALADDSGLAAHSIDLVTVAQALHWLPHARFFAEVRRVLAPDGVLAVWCYTRPLLPGVLGQIVDTFYYGDCGPYWFPERALVDDAYSTIDIPIVEIASPPLSIDAMLLLAQFAGYLRTWSAARALAAAIGHDPVVAVEDALRAHWGGADARQPVRWPMHVRAGRLTPSA
ncbi:MAG TPA: class I SAM-dependent methyltransferase [Gemmatimonadaceae bacterium]|nr:class I SAM-dependent methyltransferase [Gemmatimonadaceae bacterium]